MNSYFSTKRGRAVGLALAGTGLGQMIMPNIVRILLDEYGFKGATLIMGALAFNGVIGASLFQPVEWHMKQFEKTCSIEKRMLLQPCRHSANQHAYQEVASDGEYEIDDEDENRNICVASDTKYSDREAILQRKPNWKKRIFKALDLQLLFDPIFISIAIGLALAYTASINFSMLFPYFLQVSEIIFRYSIEKKFTFRIIAHFSQETAGLSRTDTALCMSLLATADLASRLTLPTLTDKLKISCRMIFLVGAILLTITREILAGTSSRRNLLIMSTIYGYVRAATVVNQNLTISEYASQDKLASALSLNMIAKGIFVMTIGQLLGICSTLEQANHITKKHLIHSNLNFFF